MFEIQELVLKLRKPEVPWSIANIVLDFEPLLEQIVQVIRENQESAIRFELRAGILRKHQSLVSEFQTQVYKLKENTKENNKLATLEVDILTWTQQINWLHMKIEATQIEKAELNASDLDYVDQKLIEAANTGLKHAKTSKVLEAEVDKLRAVNCQVNKKLERTRMHFEELRKN